MKRLIFILVFFPLLMQAQWNYTYGDSTINENGFCIVYTSDGNYVIGSSKKGVDSDIMTLHKVNEFGETIWHKEYNQNTENKKIYFLSLEKTENGGFIFLGNKLINLDSKGEIKWMKPNIKGIDLILCEDKKSYLLINYTRYISYFGNLSLSRIDSVGDVIWTSYCHQRSYCLTNTSDGKYVVFGTNEHGNSSSGYWTTFDCVKINDDKEIDWFKNNGTYGIAATNTKNNGFIIAGIQHAINKEYMSLQHIDSIGNSLWYRYYQLNSSSTDEYLSHAIETHDGGFIAIGSGVIRTDENGDTLWTRADINGKEIHQINDSSFVLVRTDIDTITGDKNINIIKLTDNGEIAGDFIIPTPPTTANVKIINIIDFTGRQTKVKPNLPLIYIYDDGTTEKKMIIE